MKQGIGPGAVLKLAAWAMAYVLVQVSLVAKTVVVDIPDINLRWAIHDMLEVPMDSEITVADMESLTELEALWAIDLTGLETATNLTRLKLGGSGWTSHPELTDIRPLAVLTKLTHLTIDYAFVSDISPLAGLTNLTVLSLFHQQIRDLSPLAGLTNLTKLWLGVNEISDLSPLTGLTNLTELNLWKNEISDLSPLAGLTNLTVVWLWDNDISDLSPLTGLTNLVRLSLSSNNISDLSPLAGLVNLEHLDLRNNNISNISPLVDLANLKCYGPSTDWWIEWTPALKLNENYIDITPGSAARQIIDHLINNNATAGELGIGYDQQKAYETWANYPVRPDGTVDTWGWLDVLNINTAPWVWCLSTNFWFYITESVAASGNGWIYSIDLSKLETYYMPSTNWGWSFKMSKWVYVYGGATDGQGWVYVP